MIDSELQYDHDNMAFPAAEFPWKANAEHYLLYFRDSPETCLSNGTEARGKL